MEPSSPHVSVIVPIFNAEAYLDQCLNSIKRQTYENLEIICINDGSTDNSLSIITDHAQHDRRIRVIDKQNEGYGASCNLGINAAQGIWISIIEPDDWIEPTMYGDMIAFQKQLGHDADIIKTPYWRIWMPDTPQQRKINCSYRRRIKPPSQPFGVAAAPHLLTHHPSIWSALYLRSFLNEKNIRFIPYPGAGWADNPFLIETLCQTSRIVYLDKPYYCYREETPEKTAALARTNTLLPLNRWNDMTDVLDRLDEQNESIRRAHNSRGFTYLGGILEEVDIEQDNIKEVARCMFERMEPYLVFSDPDLSLSYKRMFASARGIDLPPLNRATYTLSLLKQGAYHLRNSGISFTWFELTNYLKSKAQREGQR